MSNYFLHNWSCTVGYITLTVRWLHRAQSILDNLHSLLLVLWGGFRVLLIPGHSWHLRSQGGDELGSGFFFCFVLSQHLTPPTEKTGISSYDSQSAHAGYHTHWQQRYYGCFIKDCCRSWNTERIHLAESRCCMHVCDSQFSFVNVKIRCWDMRR